MFDLGLIACALVVAAVFLGRLLLRRKAPSDRKAPPDNAGLLDAIIARQSPPSTLGQRQQRRPAPTQQRRPAQNSQLATLEGHLRHAILDPGARERLVNDGMRTTAGDRAAAIRKVLADLHGEDKRWG